MKIAIVTDAWSPQINGVVITLKQTLAQLTKLGHQVAVFNPSDFLTFPMPGYPEIRLSWLPGRKLGRMLDAFNADAIHVSTEGPLGQAARRYCLKNRLNFTTAYHTRFPEYLRLRLPIPFSLSYGYMRRFHNSASATMVATPSLERELRARGFTNLRRWSRGVDIDLFQPQNESHFSGDRPIAVFLGRVAVEKNIKAYLDLDITATKYIIGDGPEMDILKKQYPDAHFVGYKTGEDLVAHLASADVMVFPSLTDTFGLVLLEAMACGVPVAAYPVTGPKDIIENGINGWVDGDLAYAVEQALNVSPQRCKSYAEKHSWERATNQFLSNLVLAKSKNSSIQISHEATASWL
ncbi:MAG: glycosyltransferase family 1 protein [Pseudomonadota bacterium]|nr:glycosyltransferase family 1 protein [Pseudomonadota bacterium]